MKVLLVNEYSKIPGGIESVVNIEKKYLIKSGTDVKTFSCYNMKIMNQGFYGKLHTIGSAVRGNYLRDELITVINNFKPDIVHLHNIYPLLSRMEWKDIIPPESKLVLHLHNFNPLCLNSFFYNGGDCSKCLEVNSWINGICSKCFHNSYAKSVFIAMTRKRPGNWIKSLNEIQDIIAVSEYIKQEFVKAGVPERKIKVLPNPVEYPLNEVKGKDDYVLCLGNMRYEKGTDIFCKAALENPKIKFIAAGDGPELAFYRKKYLHVKNLFFPGYVYGKNKTELIRNAAFFCIPSRSPESFGLVILESFALGKPVLSTGHGAAGELIKNNITGRLTDEKNFSAEVNLLWNEIKSRPGYYHDNCRRTAVRYSAEIHTEKLLNIYNNTLC